MTQIEKELKQALQFYKYSPKDILWIGSRNGKFAMSYEKFIKKFGDKKYDASFGIQMLAADLVIVFKDGGYLSRTEYEGSEKWELHKTPQLQKNAKTFEEIFVEHLDSDDDNFWWHGCV